MKKYIHVFSAFFAAFLLWSCSTEDCETYTVFYDLEEYSVAEKDSILVAYDHQIRVDTIIAGFMLMDTTEVDDPDNPDSILIDTTIINPGTQITLSNAVYGLNETKTFSRGDSVYFGTEDMKENYSRIMIIFRGLDSLTNDIILQINEGKLYQDCSQW
jgi:hypothetical protein